MRLKSPKLHKINTTFTKMSSKQNMMSIKHVADELISPEEEEDISTRRDTDTIEADGDQKRLSINPFNDIKVSYLNLSEDMDKKKLKSNRNSYGLKYPSKKFTPKGGQGMYLDYLF